MRRAGRFLFYGVCCAALGCALHRALCVSWWVIVSVAAGQLWWAWSRPQLLAVLRPGRRPNSEGE